MTDGRIAFTVFTATFNRAHTLHRVHESLRTQTYRSFEWLVVDDGSTDGTRALVEGWIAEGAFPIRYLHQPNRGKHVAFNRGVAAARGELFISLDSDDACLPRALERLKWHWDQIPAEERPRFTGVTGRCVDQHGAMIGPPLPSPVLDSDSNEIRYRYGLYFEKWGFHVVEHLREHPFPELTGKFVPEGLVWYALARKYRTRYVDEPVRVYWLTGREGAQLTTTAPSADTAAALALANGAMLNHDLRWFRYAPRAFLHGALNYTRFSLEAGSGLAAQGRKLDGPAQLLWLAAMPLGVAAYLWDAARARRAEPREEAPSDDPRPEPAPGDP